MGYVLMGRSTKRQREMQKMVASLTPNFSIETTRNTHLKVTVWGPAGSKFVIASGTGSDHRHGKNFMTDLTRAIADVGTGDPASAAINLPNKPRNRS